MMIAAAVLSLLALAGAGAPRLRKLADKRAWIVYGCLFAVIAVFTLRYVYGKAVYGPMEAIMSFVRNTLGLSMKEICGNTNDMV
ncbi:MAG: hypothetical protein LBS11_03490 [Oscillospiraceae bacterium]|jgi:hypothetical protein|nr:hypothetical protein [Oscillospiraceae bacterium]